MYSIQISNNFPKFKEWIDENPRCAPKEHEETQHFEKDLVGEVIVFTGFTRETHKALEYEIKGRGAIIKDTLVVGKGGRMIIMAMTDLHEGDEIFLDYGVSYWADKADRLTPTQAEEVASLVEQRGVQVGEVQPIVSSPMEQAEVEVQAPGVRKIIVRSRIEQLSDIERERYVVDNVEQTEELAEELQYLVGHSFIDDENGHQYVVESVLYDEEHKAVIAYRRAMDGASHALDDSPYLVYGDGGILQLCELWNVDSGQNGVRWPQGEAEWAQMQQQDTEGARLAEVCEETGQEYQIDRDTYMVQGEHRVMYRKAEMTSRVKWQLWVPELLRRLCMEIHHEGSAHPGSYATDQQASVLLARHASGGGTALCGVSRVRTEEQVPPPAEDSYPDVPGGQDPVGTPTHRPDRGAASHGWEW